MKAYEGLFIFPPDSSAEARKEQFKNLDDAFAKFHGNVTQKTEWGKKQIGYPLKKFQEGHFLIVDFQMDPLQLPELNKVFNLQEGLLKFMITVKQESRPNPKAQKSEPTSVSQSQSTPRPAPAVAASKPAGA